MQLPDISAARLNGKLSVLGYRPAYGFEQMELTDALSVSETVPEFREQLAMTQIEPERVEQVLDALGLQG
jgi:hypothetical protein